MKVKQIFIEGYFNGNDYIIPPDHRIHEEFWHYCSIEALRRHCCSGDEVKITIEVVKRNHNK